MKNQTYLLMLSSFFFLLCSYNLSGQNSGYKLAIGARLGSPVSASAKLFISEKGALEGYLGSSFWWYSGYRSVNANLAYLHHESLGVEDLEGLRFYFGAGAGTQFWRYKKNFVDPGDDISVSLTAYIGLDYYFDDMPLNLSIDWQPTLFIGSILSPFGYRYGSIGIRYIL